jgi:hypothetical protein
MKMFYGLFQCYLWSLEYLLWYLEDIFYNQGILIGWGMLACDGISLGWIQRMIVWSLNHGFGDKIWF